MFMSSEHVGNDFRNVMQNANTHPFAGLANDGKNTQSTLFKNFETCEKQFEATGFAHFKQLTAHFASVKDRIKQREASRLEFDYRTGKAKSAQESRDKLVAKGKLEAPKDAEARALAEKKLEEATANWNAINSTLCGELVFFFENRHAILGNLYIEFLQFQMNVAVGFQNSLGSLSIPAIPANCAWRYTADSKGPVGSGEEFADVSLHTAAVSPAKPAKSAAGPASPPLPPPPSRLTPPTSRPPPPPTNAVATVVIASLPEPQQTQVAISDQGVNISAHFADDDEAAMRVGVTVKPEDAISAAQFALKHKQALGKLAAATANN